MSQFGTSRTQFGTGSMNSGSGEASWTRALAAENGIFAEAEPAWQDWLNACAPMREAASIIRHLTRQAPAP